jgi:hypothetical protein
MNKSVIRTLIILLAILALAVYLQLSMKFSEEPKVSVNTYPKSEIKTATQHVLPDDEIPAKINGHDSEPIQDESPEQGVEAGLQPVRYTRDLGV